MLPITYNHYISAYVGTYIRCLKKYFWCFRFFTLRVGGYRHLPGTLWMTKNPDWGSSHFTDWHCFSAHRPAPSRLHQNASAIHEIILGVPLGCSKPWICGGKKSEPSTKCLRHLTYIPTNIGFLSYVHPSFLYRGRRFMLCYSWNTKSFLNMLLNLSPTFKNSSNSLTWNFKLL